MHWIHEIREKYGIQQIELATFLGVSRSVISLAELNQRELPTKALISLSSLLTKDELTLTDGITEQLKAIEDEGTYETNRLKQKVYRDSEVKLMRAERKLKIMQAKYQQGINALRLASKLQSLPKTDNDVRRDNFIESLCANAFVSLRQNGQTAQLPLLATIKQCEMLMNTYKKAD